MIWAIYEDDTFICLGTLHEIADYLGIGYKSLLSYKSRGQKYIFVKCQVIKGTFRIFRKELPIVLKLSYLLLYKLKKGDVTYCNNIINCFNYHKYISYIFYDSSSS